MTRENSGLTFLAKNPSECPVCETSFYREELRTGRGRMIAGELTDELRRTYEPSQKYGEVYPLIYPVVVCPECFYAAYGKDFFEADAGALQRVEGDTDRRKQTVGQLFSDLDFTDYRRLDEGVASYVLAASCYDQFPSEFSPTFKQGLSCLRAAWLCADLHRKSPDEHYDYLALVFYRKARFFYILAVEREQNGEEQISASGNLGPDLDKNFGYDGVLYLSGLLEYRYGPRSDPDRRAKALDRAKRTIARIFGMGKASRSKPAAILDKARDVYRAIGQELGQELRDPEEDLD